MLSTNESIMLQALELALQGRWSTAPNPCVGAVLVKEGTIVAKGWHRGIGQPHAEVEAITDCRCKGIKPSLCSLWVTMEPCNHTGKTLPCTQAILAAGINEVYVGTLDPNPLVQGRGITFLREHGITVHTNIAHQYCKDAIADFRTWNLNQRPYLILKLACTLDGKIATRTGDSKWISSPEARAEIHKVRNFVQAVLVGGRTFIQDNPWLTAYYADYELLYKDKKIGTRLFKPPRQPLAVVATSQLPESKASLHLLQARPTETIFLTTKNSATSNAAIALKKLGCRVWGITTLKDSIDLYHGLNKLWKELQCYYLLCEGGGTLGMSLLDTGLVDELWLYIAPKVLGDIQAISLFMGRNIHSIDQAINMRICSMRQIGQDIALVLRPQ